MKTRGLRRVDGGPVVSCEIADRLWTRVRGLLGRDGLPQGAALCIVPCDSIHMLGMRFPIDALFLDRSLTAVRLVQDLAPGRIVWPVRHARCVIELAAGSLRELGWAEGDRMEWIDAPTPGGP